MAKATNSIEIRRPADQVYGFLADGLNNPKWRPAVKSISLASGRGGEVGAIYKQQIAGPGGRPVSGDYRIVEAVPGKRVRFEVISGPARPVGVFDIQSQGAGARVTFSLELQPKGLMRLMNGMIQKTMEAEVANLTRLKTVIEAA